MDVEMVLNDLSVASPADTIHTAREWMDSFVATLVKASKLGIRPIVRVERGLDAILLAPDYPFPRWRNDNAVRREAQSFVRSLTSKTSFLDGIQDEAILEAAQGCDFRFDGRVANGLGMAFVMQGLSVSMRSETAWDCSRIQIEVLALDEDSGDVTTTPVAVTHASCPAHVEEHAVWIERRTREGVTNGAELVARRADLLPSLILCDTAVTTLERLDSGSPHFPSILKRLLELEDYAAGWLTGPFNARSLPCKATPESAQTLARYGGERTFRCPDGTQRCFSWHVRLTPDNWRIHFDPDAGSHTIVVGYMGPKLPTVLYPT